MNRKNFNMMAITTVVSSALILSACGGSSSTDSTDSTAVSRGVITGFGSVYVNGIKYETTASRFSVDDVDEQDQSGLKVGMMVTVRGEINPDGSTGTADSITYNDDLKGPISNITEDLIAQTKTLTILGKTILVTLDTVFDDDDDDYGLTYANMVVYDVIEVSGFVTANGITATHIEKQGVFDPANPGNSEIEIVGTIAGLTSSTFTIDGLDVVYDGTTKLDDINVLSDGLFVEVKGTLDSSGALVALKIEGEDEGLGDDVDEVELEGIISNYDSNTNTFSIQGQDIDASRAELSPSNLTLEDGLSVKVEGEIVDGVLIAEEVDKRGQKLKIKAHISDKDETAGTISFVFNNTTITVRVNTQTEMEDDRDSIVDLSLSDLAVGDFVEMKAFYDGSDTINAYELERKSDSDVKIEGPVSAFSEANETVTILGATFDLSAATLRDFANNAGFYAALTEGLFIQLRDNLPLDGVIDEVEIDD